MLLSRVSRVVVSVLALIAAGAMPAVAGDAPAGSSQQGQTPIDQIDMGNPEPGKEPAPPEQRNVPKFFSDTQWSGQVRSFELYRDKYDDSLMVTWALGGSVSYLSGYAGRFRLGAVGYASFPVRGPEDRDGAGLLQPGQEAYGVLGQLYGEVKLADGIFTAFGRKEYNTPYLNKNDVRMTPKTFEGLSVYGKRGGADGKAEWRFGGGYITQIKERNSDEFVWMSDDIGAVADVERGVFVGGFNFKKKGWSAGAFEYYSDDIINIFYTEFAHESKFGEAETRKLKFSGQFTDQRSTGDELLTGADFSTYQWGVKGDFTAGGAMFTLGYTDTGSDADIRAPWSGHPGYTSVQVQDFYRAGESATILRFSYDFAKHGAKGFTTYALWVHGSGVDAPSYNEDEYDLNVQWDAAKTHVMRGLSLRLRYARVEQDGGGDPEIDDFRFIVNYDLPRRKM